MDSNTVIPNGWTLSTIEKIVEIISVTGLKIKQGDYLKNGKIPVIDQGQTLIGGYTDQEDLKIKCDLPVIVFGDHTKTIKYIDFEFAAGADGVKVIKPLGVNPQWLYYMLHIIQLPDKGYARHFQYLKKASILIPPLKEQERIVDKIEQLVSNLDDGLKNLNKAINLMTIYRLAVSKAGFMGQLSKSLSENLSMEDISGEGLLKEILSIRRRNWEDKQLRIFKTQGKEPKNDRWKEKYKEPKPPMEETLPQLPEGWVWASMDQIGEVTGGLTKNGSRIGMEIKLPYLRVANVYYGKLDLVEIKTIGLGKEELERVLLEHEDLLIVEGNGSIGQIGRAALWDGSIDPCVHQNHIIKVRFADKRISKFVLAWLISQIGREYVVKAASSTSGLHTLSVSKIANLPIPLPSVQEQNLIINEMEARLSVQDKAKETLELQVRRAEALRKSIFRKAYIGKLVSQIPSEEPAEILLKKIEEEKAVKRKKK